MRSFGEPIVEWFGDEPEFEGYSLVQLIHTSSITGHFAAGHRKSAFIDIFSCKRYSCEKAVAFCKSFFDAGSVGTTTLDRGTIL